MRLPFLTLLLLLGGLLPAAEKRPPDIVLFLADDLSVDDISPHGTNGIRTPEIEALAREGMFFDRAYVASPSCAPSRAALLTGCYGLRNGSTFNHQAVRPAVKKWPAYFQTLGYEVAAIGKVSHYGHVRSYGFDHASHFTYHEDVCVEKAVEWLAARKSGKPLCLIVGTNWPHVPWPAQGLPPQTVSLPKELADTPETRAARSRYASAVANADHDLGLVRAAVAKHLPAGTVFVFSSDHGSQFPFSKWNLYEAGLRVPIIVSWPGRTAPGSRTAALVSWVDLLPTLLEAAGADPARAAPDIDGRSFLTVVLGRSESHRDRVFATHSGDGDMNFYPARSVRIGPWKYIRNLDPTLEFHSHVDKAPGDTGYWPSWVREAGNDAHIASLVGRYLRRPAEELYHLDSDPRELTNLAAQPEHAAELARLRSAVDEWMRSLGDEGMSTELARRPRPKDGAKPTEKDP